MNISIDHFNPFTIAESGQCFRWEIVSKDTVKVTAFERVLIIEKQKNGYSLSCDKEEYDKLWAPYFDIDTDYFLVEKLVKDYSDKHLSDSYNKGEGIRILRQDLWEVIISFLISQNNNIGRIKKSVEALAVRGGRKALNDSESFSFPRPEDITDFSNLGLGYREEYLKEMFSFALNNPSWLDYLKTLSYEEARKELLKRKGIGPKVADCICLFGLHHVKAFPIDTHVKDLLNKYYKEGFNHEYFKGYSGIIQQYLFYFEIKK